MPLSPLEFCCTKFGDNNCPEGIAELYTLEMVAKYLDRKIGWTEKFCTSNFLSQKFSAQKTPRQFFSNTRLLTRNGYNFMNRSGFYTTSFVCWLLLAPTLVAADEATLAEPAAVDVSGDETEGRRPQRSQPRQISLSDVQMIPLFSVTMDIAALRRFRTQLQERSTQPPVIAEYLDRNSLFMLTQDGVGIAQDVSTGLRYNATMTRPAIGYFGDFVYPFGPEVLEALEAEDGLMQREPNVYEMGETLVVISGTTLAASQAEDIAWSEQDIARLRRLIQEAESSPPPNLAAISIRPQTIGRSAVKQELAGFRARRLAEAQQRDDDDELDSLTRGVWQQLQISLFDAFFNDTEQLNYTLDFDAAAQSLTVELKLKCAKRSPLDDSIVRIAATRGRALSYLHPNQVGFVCATVPLPKDIATSLPLFAALCAHRLEQTDGLADSLPAVIEQTLQKFADDRQVECLLQAVATDHKSTVYLMVMPLEYASTLQAPLIQLVSATSTTPHTIGEAGGFQVTELPDGKLLFEDPLGIDSMPAKTRAMLVTTDQCLAVMLGTEQDLPLLDTILKQDFEPPPAAKRFRQSIFAAEAGFTSLASLDKSVLHNTLSLAKQQGADDDSPQPSGKIEIYLHTAPQELTLTARFESDTMLTGITLVDSSVRLLIGLYESFFDE